LISTIWESITAQLVTKVSKLYSTKNFYRTVQFPNHINPVRIFASYFLMFVTIFTSDFYSGLQSVLFPSVSVSDSMDNLLVSLIFFNAFSLSVEVHWIRCFDICHLIQIIQPTRYNSFTGLLLNVYVWLSLFRASSHNDARTCERQSRHLLYETLSVIYLKQNQMCNPSQTFGL
jgi:hypothetical protein